MTDLDLSRVSGEQSIRELSEELETARETYSALLASFNEKAAEVERLRGELERSRYKGDGSYPRAIGEIEGVLGITRAVPLSETVDAVRRLQADITQARALLERYRKDRHGADLMLDIECDACLARAPAQTAEPDEQPTPVQRLIARNAELHTEKAAAESTLAAVQIAWHKLDSFWSYLSSQEMYGESLHELLGEDTGHGDDEESDLLELTDRFQAVRDLLRPAPAGKETP